MVHSHSPSTWGFKAPLGSLGGCLDKTPTENDSRITRDSLCHLRIITFTGCLSHRLVSGSIHSVHGFGEGS